MFDVFIFYSRLLDVVKRSEDGSTFNLP
jgi:hypothetical protein